MTMSKNEIIKVLFLKHLLTVLHQPFVLLMKESLLLGAGDTTMPRPGSRNAYTQVRVNSSKQPLTETATEYLFEDLILPVARTETISVMYIETLSTLFDDQVIGYDIDSNLL